MLTGEELGRAIDAAIKKKGITKKAVAAHFGIAPPSIQDWVKRGTIDKDKLPKLWALFADVVGPEHWGLERYPTGSPHEPPAAQTDPHNSVIDMSTGKPLRRAYDHLEGGTVSLSLLDVSASMGAGVIQPDHDDVIRTMHVNEAWLRRHAASFSSPDNLSLITGFGDSMEPTFKDGDSLLVDRAVTDIKLDAIYVLALSDELYIKRLQRRPGGEITMISDNKSYEPYTIKNGERDKFRVLGRVVMAWNSRRI